MPVVKCYIQDYRKMGMGTYTTKIGTFVSPPHISETVAVRLLKLAHRSRIASTTKETISKKIYCPFYQFYFKQTLLLI